MKLQQAATLLPFVQEPVSFAHIARWTSEHKIIRPVCTTPRHGDDMVNLVDVLVALFHKGRLAIVTLVVLSLQLILDILRRVVPFRAHSSCTAHLIIGTVLLRPSFIIRSHPLARVARASLPKALALLCRFFWMALPPFSLMLTGRLKVCPLIGAVPFEVLFSILLLPLPMLLLAFFSMLCIIAIDQCGMLRFLLRVAIVGFLPLAPTRPTGRADAPLFPFVGHKELRSSGEPLVALCAALARGIIQGYNVHTVRLTLLSSRLRHVTSMRGVTTFLPLYYTITPPVEQLEGVLW